MVKPVIKNSCIVLAMIFILSTIFSGCVPKSDESITIIGSTALLPLVKGVADDYMGKNADARIQVQGGGSGTGLTQVSQGGADIGNSDIFAEEKLPPEKAKELVDHKVCVVGFAVVVNPSVKVDSLSQQQLIGIFTGNIKNWKDVGGDDQNIVIINRPASSGTRATFRKYALNGEQEAQGKLLTQDSSGAVRKTVAETSGAISYLAFLYLNESIKALKYNGIEPTSENIAQGSYPLWSYEHMYTKGEAQGIEKQFIEYMLSDYIQNNFVTKLKYIPIFAMKVTR